MLIIHGTREPAEGTDAQKSVRRSVFHVGPFTEQDEALTFLQDRGFVHQAEGNPFLWTKIERCDGGDMVLSAVASVLTHPESSML